MHDHIQCHSKIKGLLSARLQIPNKIFNETKITISTTTIASIVCFTNFIKVEISTKGDNSQGKNLGIVS